MCTAMMTNMYLYLVYTIVSKTKSGGLGFFSKAEFAKMIVSRKQSLRKSLFTGGLFWFSIQRYSSKGLRKREIQERGSQRKDAFLPFGYHCG